MTGHDQQSIQEVKEVSIVRGTIKDRDPSIAGKDLFIADRTSQRTVKSDGHLWYRKRWWRMTAWVLGALLGMTLMTAAYAGFVIYKWSEMADYVSIGTSSAASSDASAPLAQEFEKPKTFLVLGMDTRKDTGSLNTDVILVGTVNPQSGKVTLVSIPRDTWLFPGERRWKANGYYANYFVDERATVAQNVKESFGRYLNTEIDYMITLNFKAFEQMIDDLGGLQLNVDQDMRYTDKSDGTNINLKAGIQQLDGKNTLDFVRYRKSNDGTKASNDIERNERQSQVLREMMEQLKSLNGVLNIGNIIDALRENMTTDIPANQLLPLTREYMGIRKENVTFVHLVGEWKSPYIHVGEDELKIAQNALKATR